MKPIKHIEFEWPHCPAGYTFIETEFVEHANPREYFLVLAPKNKNVTKTDWLTVHPGLFKDFAKIEETEKGVLKFTDRFGLLLPFEYGDAPEKGLPLIEWFDFRRDFEQIINSKHDSSVFDRPPIPQFLKDDPRFEIIDLELSPLDRVNRFLFNDVTTQIEETTETGRMNLVIRPGSLLAAMAIQMGMWLGEPTEYIRQCLVCGKSFEFGTGTGRRSTAKYCNRQCENRANYQKMKTKRTMSGE